jgi:segregation and condensation protein A
MVRTMNIHVQGALEFDAATAAADEDTLLIDIDGYEGPLHVLLALARSQKVDLIKLSITRLADQYLAFIRQSRRMRFSLAADYLVMAAWLAFLKSRLLLPKPERPPEEQGAPELMADQLAFRLAKLDAMRTAAEQLKMLPVLKRDVFTRGDPEAVSVVSHRRLQGDLAELMASYLEPRARTERRIYRPRPVDYYRLDDARARMRRILPALHEWTSLAAVAPDAEAGGPTRRSCVASTLSASLEMVREGELEVRQTAPFAEVFLRAAPTAALACVE